MILGGAADPSPSTQTIDLKEQTSTAAEGEAQVKNARDTSTNETPHTESEPVQPGEISGQAVLATPEFWDDLQGFLEQRLKDTDEAKKVRELFETVIKK